MRIGAVLEQDILGSFVEGVERQRGIVRARDHDHRHVGVGRENGLERVGRPRTGLAHAEQDAIDEPLGQSAAGARHGVADEHLGLRADRFASALSQRRGVLRTLVYDEQS
ncbi:MAG TPA: hypothetical protein VIH85_14625 [Solirubrobacteraceae bacterium]